MKLKTLKDFEFEVSNIDTDKQYKNYIARSIPKGSLFVNPKELKAEVTKWVKRAWKGGKTYGDIKMMCEFFNITEEDLK